MCAVERKSVASLFVRDDRLSLGECDGVSVLNDLIYADKGCGTVVRGDLDFVVSDVDQTLDCFELAVSVLVLTEVPGGASRWL